MAQTAAANKRRMAFRQYRAWTAFASASIPEWLV